MERRIVSVLFADLVGFTSLSERLDPEDVATVQDAYFSAVRETIGRYGGQLEKFIGDAAMAVFGIPRTRDDDTERAVRAGLALVGAVEQLSARVGLEPGDLALRVGINTGEVVYGEQESDQWRVTGDTVNVAARLQAAAPSGGVVIGEATTLAVAEAVEAEPLGPIDLKGKGVPVRAWLAHAARAHPSREYAMGELKAPILGREDEFEALGRAAARVAGGGSERWVVVAPPGVGKSRLLEEFAHRSSDKRRAQAVRVWRARLRPDVLAPYEPVAQLFASALGAEGWDVMAAGAADRLKELVTGHLRERGATKARSQVVADEVRGVLMPEGADAADGSGTIGAGEREQRFMAWLEALDALASGTPAIWIVEDVHWSGGDLLAFLALAGVQSSGPGRLVLATARPSILERAPEWCRPSEQNNLLHLSPLSAVASEGLVAALVGKGLPSDLVTAVAERSDGNPLFIEELLRTWISVGTLTRNEGGGWALAAPADEVHLPSTVQAIYAAQLDDLSPDARQTARHASVAGRRFPRDALEPLGVLNPDPALDVLTRRALVAGPFADSLLGRSHQFRHALLRDAGYASLARAERARLHLRLARWLEQAAGPRWAEVASVIGNHYRAALEAAPALTKDVGDGVERTEAARLAASWFDRAAAAAVEVAAHDAARTLLRQALDLTPDADLIERASRWQRLGDATAYVADMDVGAAAFETAAELFKQKLSDPKASSAERGEARAGHAGSITALGLVLIQQLRFQEAIAIAETGLETIGPADDLPTAWLRYLRAWGSIAWAPRPEARPDLDAALGLARTHRDRRLELEARFLLLTLQMEEGEIALAESDAVDVEIATLAEENGQWDRACRAWRTRAMIRSEVADDAWNEPLARAAFLAEAHGLTEEIAWNEYSRVEIGLLLGDWDAALESGQQALDLADRNAYHRVQVRTWFALSPIAVARERRDLLGRAFRWFDEHQAIFPPSPYGRFMHAALNCRFAGAGLPAAPVLTEDLLEFWAETPGWPSSYAAMETVIEGWLGAADTELAEKAVERAAAWAEHPTMTEFYGAEVSLLRSRVLQATGQARRSGESARQALAVFRRLRTPWWAGKSIRLLEAIGEASADELLEAEAIERMLEQAGPSR